MILKLTVLYVTGGKEDAIIYYCIFDKYRAVAA